MKKYTVRNEIEGKVKDELKIYPELTQRLLAYRGIDNAKDACEFLNPNYDEGINNPFLMEGMEKAVSRILSAIDNDEHIVIYSDYDCDGIPGGVVLHDFFKKIEYENFSNYIPHRHEEGFGLNMSALDKAKENDAKVLITVDCGIVDDKPVDHANKLGIDVIITDHHLENGTIPKAYAILDPKQEKDTTYPFDSLCGAGVAFKLVQGLLEKGDFDVVEGWDKWLLDMAGLSTIADMVPLIGENRIIAHYGLQVLRKSRRPGIQQLCKKIKVNQKYITEDDIGFMIGPRINAASRMDHPIEAFKLLSTESIEEGGTLSDYLDKLNNQRKGIVASMTKELNKRAKELRDEKEVIVLGNPDWKPALLGLVANNFTKEYGKPVFIWGREVDGKLKGSCRSDGSVNLVELIGSLDDVFEQGGGHAFSAGFSVYPDKIHELEKRIIEKYKQIKKEIDREVFVDKKMSIDDVNWKTYGEIEKFAPFGVGNEKPLFLFEDLVIDEVKHFGKEKNHLKLVFKNFDEKKIEAMAFFVTADDFKKEIKDGGKVNLVGSVEKSTFRNFPELRIRIVDII